MTTDSRFADNPVFEVVGTFAVDAAGDIVVTLSEDAEDAEDAEEGEDSVPGQH